MAENVGGQDLFGSGGRVWAWGNPQRTGKTLQTAGLRGAAYIYISSGGRPVTIQGRDGGPAILKATGGSRALADAAVDALEDAIETKVEAAEPCNWEDDCGRTGTTLVVLNYRRGRRVYNQAGATWTVWQYYHCDMMELSGAI